MADRLTQAQVKEFTDSLEAYRDNLRKDLSRIDAELRKLEYQRIAAEAQLLALETAIGTAAATLGDRRKRRNAQ